jgi:disulfide oxidoreductase YuzD
LELTVYGAEAVCASCVQAPPAKTTAEWLQAALARKFDGMITVRYIDIYKPETEKDQQYCDKIIADDYFYPLVVSGDQILGEGFISLKPIAQFCISKGIRPLEGDR